MSAFRFKERYVLVFICLIAFTCFLFIIFLPTGDEIVLRPSRFVGDLSNLENRLRDQERLRKKIERASIPPFVVPIAHQQIVHITDANYNDSQLIFQRNFIIDMTKFAWKGYKEYAWGFNELRPVSQTSHSPLIFGSGKTGATIVDAIDTFYIMNLMDEYNEAYNWIRDEFDLRKTNGDISVFETNIRFIGGLLAAYALTNDEMFKQKAREVADLILPAFTTPTGIPFSVINVKTSEAHNWGWASGGCSILSEFGSLQLEFNYLTRITNNSTYSDKVTRISEVLSSLEKPDGLYPNYLNPKTGKWGQKHVSIGALGDSFYEYLLKSWLISNKLDSKYKVIYDDAMDAIKTKLLKYSEQSHLAYFIELKGNRVEHKMDHLACFVAGLLALEALNESDEQKRFNITTLAEEIGNTCHESYIRTGTNIGPESFRFSSDVEAMAIFQNEKYYILRPEAIEGWFYLWRLTHNQKYRDWCWDAALSIEKYCRTLSGYSGIKDVYTTKVDLDDVQQSFLFAETFKYLFLVFSSDETISLNKWVFNTEAHPLPVFTTDFKL